MSDGTLYALSLLVAVLDRCDRDCLTLVEEPERGLHPLAIGQFIDFLREMADSTRPIWITTHSESVVRHLRLPELVLVDKKDGRTVMKQVASGNLDDADMDAFGMAKAWLPIASTAICHGERRLHRRRLDGQDRRGELHAPTRIRHCSSREHPCCPSAQYFVERVAALGT